MISPVIGVTSLGLTTIVQPAVIAGATFAQIHTSGHASRDDLDDL